MADQQEEILKLKSKTSAHYKLTISGFKSLSKLWRIEKNLTNVGAKCGYYEARCISRSIKTKYL